jgi:GNAT superfamily N-acetyltransferase
MRCCYELAGMTGGDLEQALPNIDIDESPDPGLRDVILQPLKAFNESHIGPVKPEPLAITLRDPESGAVTGGLWGSSVVGWLYVDLLVVPEGFRGQGLGTALLQTAEEIARKRGCIGMWLHTATFQAPGFYEKLGFQAFGTVPDYPRGHGTIYYSKRLDA